jgi:enamine deaminase RidA (YjgF/YER057c/UK114 family)
MSDPTSVELSNPASMAAPVGAYSHVARIPLRDADMLVISGQLAPDLDNDDLIAQTEQCMEQLRLAVESFGGSMRDIVKLTTFVTRIERRDELRAMRVRYFGDRFPASTLVQVAGLVDPRALVEIEAIAVIGHE